MPFYSLFVGNYERPKRDFGDGEALIYAGLLELLIVTY